MLLIQFPLIHFLGYLHKLGSFFSTFPSFPSYPEMVFLNVSIVYASHA